MFQASCQRFNINKNDDFFFILNKEKKLKSEKYCLNLANIIVDIV